MTHIFTYYYYNSIYNTYCTRSSRETAKKGEATVLTHTRFIRFFYDHLTPRQKLANFHVSGGQTDPGPGTTTAAVMLSCEQYTTTTTRGRRKKIIITYSKNDDRQR